MMHIDKETYKISDNNYHKTKTLKTQIVIGTTLRKNNHHITRLKHKDLGESTKWNTFTINRNGDIFQHYDDKYFSDFLGVKQADKRTISILLENMGCLFEDEGKYYNWLNEVCEIDSVVEKKWFGYDYWEKVTENQIKSLIGLIKVLCKKHEIPKEIIEFQNFHKDTSKFNGIVFRSNYDSNGSDVNPFINTNELNEEIVLYKNI
jgi:N-acetyl-anhydromuramyl-L-alanine amidase AmpD